MGRNGGGRRRERGSLVHNLAFLWTAETITYSFAPVPLPRLGCLSSRSGPRAVPRRSGRPSSRSSPTSSRPSVEPDVAEPIVQRVGAPSSASDRSSRPSRSRPLSRPSSPSCGSSRTSSRPSCRAAPVVVPVADPAADRRPSSSTPCRSPSSPGSGSRPSRTSLCPPEHRRAEPSVLPLVAPGRGSTPEPAELTVPSPWCRVPGSSGCPSPPSTSRRPARRAGRARDAHPRRRAVQPASSSPSSRIRPPCSSCPRPPSRSSPRYESVEPVVVGERPVERSTAAAICDRTLTRRLNCPCESRHNMTRSRRQAARIVPPERFR